MAFTIEHETSESIDLKHFMEYASGFADLASEDALLEIAPTFKKLLNNRDFVADSINGELRGWRDFQRGNSYTGQVMLLADEPTYSIRANVWAPSLAYSDRNLNDNEFFSYELPHDHNFCFLTGGYYGPGYETSIYEWESLDLRYRGATAALRPLEDTMLPSGKMMVYRRLWDVHIQRPAPEFSISVNILPRQDSLERQCLFDQGLNRVALVPPVGTGKRDALCELAAHLNDDTTVELMHDLACTSKDLYLRGSAIEALASMDHRAAEHAALGALELEKADAVLAARAKRVLKGLEGSVAPTTQ